jgi:hypothetical protein
VGLVVAIVGVAGPVLGAVLVVGPGRVPGAEPVVGIVARPLAGGWGLVAEWSVVGIHRIVGLVGAIVAGERWVVLASEPVVDILRIVARRVGVALVGGSGLVVGWWVVGTLHIAGLVAAIVGVVGRVLGVVPVVGRSEPGLERMELVVAQRVLVAAGRRPVGFAGAMVGLAVVGSSSLRPGGFRCIVLLGRAIVLRFRIQLGRRCRSTGLVEWWGGIAALGWGRLVGLGVAVGLVPVLVGLGLVLVAWAVLGVVERRLVVGVGWASTWWLGGVGQVGVGVEGLVGRVGWVVLVAWVAWVVPLARCHVCQWTLGLWLVSGWWRWIERRE